MFMPDAWREVWGGQLDMMADTITDAVRSN